MPKAELHRHIESYMRAGTVPALAFPAEFKTFPCSKNMSLSALDKYQSGS